MTDLETQCSWGRLKAVVSRMSRYSIISAICWICLVWKYVGSSGVIFLSNSSLVGIWWILWILELLISDTSLDSLFASTVYSRVFSEFFTRYFFLLYCVRMIIFAVRSQLLIFVPAIVGTCFQGNQTILTEAPVSLRYFCGTFLLGTVNLVYAGIDLYLILQGRLFQSRSYVVSLRGKN